MHVVSKFGTAEACALAGTGGFPVIFRQRVPGRDVVSAWHYAQLGITGTAGSNQLLLLFFWFVLFHQEMMMLCMFVCEMGCCSEQLSCPCMFIEM